MNTKFQIWHTTVNFNSNERNRTAPKEIENVKRGRKKTFERNGKNRDYLMMQCGTDCKPSNEPTQTYKRINEKK